MSQQAGLWLTSSLRGQAWLRTELSGVFQSGSFFPAPAGRREFFFGIYIGSLVKLLEVNLTTLWVPCSTPPPMTQSPGVFNTLVHTEPLATHQLQVLLAHHCIPRPPLFVCFSNLGRAVSSVTSLLLWIQNVVAFSVC